MATHLEELMVDSELYGWPKVRAYHRVWLNQIKQGQAMWMEDEVNMYFFHALV